MNVQHLHVENARFHTSGKKPKIAIELENVALPSFTNANIDRTTEIRSVNSGKVE